MIDRDLNAEIHKKCSMLCAGYKVKEGFQEEERFTGVKQNFITHEELRKSLPGTWAARITAKIFWKQQEMWLGKEILETAGDGPMEIGKKDFFFDTQR